MLTALILGIVLGFTLSIPPGPLAVAVMKRALEGRFKPAMMMGLGAAAMDVVYTLAATFASSAIVVTLSNLFARNRWLSLLFQVLCVAVLILFGVRYIRQKNHPRSDRERALLQKEEAQEAKATKRGHGSPFLIGVLIAVTNLASPTFLPSMIAAVSYLHAEGFLPYGIGENVVYAFGFGFGTTIWFVVMLRFLLRYRTKLSSNFISIMFTFAGGTFLFFALVLIYNIAVHTRWAGAF